MVRTHFLKCSHEPREVATGFARVAPNLLVARFRWQRRGFVAFVEEAIDRNTQGASHFLQCFNRGNGVSILDPLDVAALQPAKPLDVALR